MYFFPRLLLMTRFPGMKAGACRDTDSWLYFGSPAGFHFEARACAFSIYERVMPALHLSRADAAPLWQSPAARFSHLCPSTRSMPTPWPLQ